MKNFGARQKIGCIILSAGFEPLEKILFFDADDPELLVVLVDLFNFIAMRYVSLIKYC
jgi:hypothetical protein